ncbi:hypothetical protein LZK98_07660 [Sphingomonas cannabina]|uniref:hypothetical protein n=1 Tax=Sphingomonas cannabina TaxID=2899123 RepID=UPI001F3A5E67|nr:hypothetical protein [Sphingomonas cannabina]UIJ46809.1 hypothetical protein LZK98_07660 [Sphingomonas cannabina]
MRIAVVALGLFAGGCATTTAPRPAAPIPVPPPRIYPTTGLERVIGQTAPALTRAFGKPDVEIAEGSARKLQFTSQICVLDAYLYPPKEGGGEPVVTHIDTRQRDGSAIDRASCVAALNRREGGK